MVMVSLFGERAYAIELDLEPKNIGKAGLHLYLQGLRGPWLFHIGYKGMRSYCQNTHFGRFNRRERINHTAII
jgi:hypothetical protein